MANITVYSVDEYKDEYNKIFAGVYNDFKSRAFSDYKFELTPLEYDDFINSVKENLVSCLILFEQDVPTGFLAYTTVISESLELNIIHIVGDENSVQKRCVLMQKFLDINADIIAKKVVTYALLGKQEEIIPELPKFGFETVNQSVMKFDFKNSACISKLRETPLLRLNNGFRTVNWDDKYFNPVCNLVLNSFKDMSDAKFDPRFTSMNGVKDIVAKIITGLYGEFLPQETKILLYHDEPVGVCFANLTNSEIANVPIVAVKEKYRGKSYGVYLLKSVVTDVYSTVMNCTRNLSELNASCDTDNLSAYKMYQAVGFEELYSYKQSYKG